VKISHSMCDSHKDRQTFRPNVD